MPMKKRNIPKHRAIQFDYFPDSNIHRNTDDLGQHVRDFHNRIECRNEDFRRIHTDDIEIDKYHLEDHRLSDKHERNNDQMHE